MLPKSSSACARFTRLVLRRNVSWSISTKWSAKCLCCCGTRQTGIHFHAHGTCSAIAANHGRSGAIATGVDEPDAEWYRGHDGWGRRTYHPVAEDGEWALLDLRQRYRRGPSQRKSRPESSMHSIQLSLKAPAWGWQSAVRSLKRMAAACGPRRMRSAVRHFISRCRSRCTNERWRCDHRIHHR